MALTKVTYSMISGGVVNVLDFGAVDDDSTNNATAISAAAAYLQSQGGGVLLFPFKNTGIYKFQVSIGSTLAAFTDLAGVEVRFEGATLADTQSYPTAGNECTAFSFTRCKNISVNANITSQLIVTGASPAIKGLVGIKLIDNCTNFDLKLTMVGGKNGVWIYRDPATQNKARQGRVAVDCTSVLYAYSGTWSGSDVIAQINATLCGRNFFIYGVENNWLYVNSKNQQVTSLIDANGGSSAYTEGCRNININYFDRDSDTTTGSPCVELVFRVAAAAFEDLNLNFDVRVGPTRPYSHTFRMVKTDSVVGHVVNGLTISGTSEHDNGLAVQTAHIQGSASPLFSSTDVIRNVSIRDFKCSGANTIFELPLETLDGPSAFLNNVECTTPLKALNGSSGNVFYTNCRTTFASSSASDIQTYINCLFSDGASQTLVAKTCLNVQRGADTITQLPNQFAFLQSMSLEDGITAPNTIAGRATLYVDSSDGDLKVKFGDGTVKTIVTDT